VTFRKILIANRGEIACRVMCTAHRLGWRTVAVYSDADAQALHARQADEAFRIGGAAASESYLDIEALLDAARRTGADAVHPGYGFLSERADFAQACLDAGLVFIGPPPKALHTMGDKARAKRLMIASGVPCVPGYLGEEQSDARLVAEALALGAPLLVKAAAGGGGRGMRLVRDLAELPAAIASARREALAAFGDGTLMLERLVEGGRHIEIQVFADAHGQVVHLGERDCTAQRRRQKLIEESPSPIVDAPLRDVMCAHAVAAARAVGYVSAGTVEFIVDAQGRHHFLEMNTRLQVEHPVTECITGLDLVEWQLRVAAGEPLPLTQQDIRFEGHAIEARLYAEDPYANWAPQTGRIVAWQPNATQVRIDHGLRVGDHVTPHYDAMLAKFIAHGRDRADAIRRLKRALEDVPLMGVQTNSRLLRDLLAHPQFEAATLTTSRLEEWAASGEPLLQRPEPPLQAWRIAAALRAGPTPALRPAGVAGFDITLECQRERRVLRAPAPGITIESQEQGLLELAIDGVHQRLRCTVAGSTVHLAIDGAVFSFVEPTPGAAGPPSLDASRVHAPMAGTVAQVRVACGESVVAGQALLSIEAMKMEMWLHVSAPGTVRALHVAAKDSVASGALLVELELAE
jgi:geranyl-CoA carboxylase alpha subunit